MATGTMVTSSSNRWSDAFLDRLRDQGDPLADEALRRIMRDGETNGVRRLFAEMDSNDEIPPQETFPELEQFFEATHRLPDTVDLERIRRGEEVFMDHAFEVALVLLAKSLPEGYAAPNLSLVLSISNDLRTHPFRRLLATLEMVLNVGSNRGFQDGGRAVITAQKLRLLHAGVRHVVERYRPGFRKRYGMPASQEDMLATIMAFSYLVLTGLRTLGVGLSRQQEENYMYLWIVFAQMMGIHPEGDPRSLEHLPADVEDAAAFYEAYKRRHYVQANENPHGVELAASNERMLRDLVPRFLRLFGFGLLPRIYMRELIGEEGCELIAIRPVWGHPYLKASIFFVHRLLNPVERLNDRHHTRLSKVLFEGMITRAYDGRITYDIPVTLKQLKGLVNEKHPVSADAGKRRTAAAAR